VSDASGIPFGKFLLSKRLARGGMAEVFLARQRGPEGFDRRVALKRILPHLVDSESFVRMFLDEARLAARLSHPNIVHIYEFGKVDEHFFIAMEYVDGVHSGMLIKLAAQMGDRLPLPLIARIGADACAGLHYAHGLESADGNPLRIVHRDVSPPNLMISFDGVVKLVDFGIAKAVSQVEQTRPGVVKGKYAYMSPEQTTSMPLDGRSDVFSLGLVLWELVAGRVAVSRSDPVEAMRRIRDGQLPAIEAVRKDVPTTLAQAINHALAVDREGRASAADLGLALEGFIKASPELGTAMELSQWIRGRFRRASTTGENPTLGGAPGATRPATVAATAAATSATLAATSAMLADTSAATSAVITDADPTVAATPAAISPGDEEDIPTEVVGGVPPGFGYTPVGPATPTGTELRPSTSRARRIAIAATITVAVGASVMLVAREGGSNASPENGAPVRAPIPDAAAVAQALPAPQPDATAAAPAAQADAAPAFAVLEVITRPPEANVYLDSDGEPQPSPAVFEELEPGLHDLRVVLEGYQPLDRSIGLAAGEHRTLELALLATPRPPDPKRVVHHNKPPVQRNGSLTARTNPYSVVYLGSRKLGVTPFANVSLPAGKHTLVFKHPGRKPFKKKVHIRPGKTTKLGFDLP